jgi:hypothetical protein
MGFALSEAGACRKIEFRRIDRPTFFRDTFFKARKTNRRIKCQRRVIDRLFPQCRLSPRRSPLTSSAHLLSEGHGHTLSAEFCATNHAGAARAAELEQPRKALQRFDAQ